MLLWMCHWYGRHLNISSVMQPVLSLSLLPPFHSPTLHVISCIFIKAEGPSYPLWLISIPTDPIVYPSSPFWRLALVGNDFPPSEAAPLKSLTSRLLWAAGSGSARAFLSHMVNKQTITAPVTIYKTVIAVFRITALSVCLLFGGMWSMKCLNESALPNSKKRKKVVIWNIHMAMNKDNYVLFYCADFPIITVKDAASFPLIFLY